jgi:type I restriction enzyme, S subunit
MIRGECQWIAFEDAVRDRTGSAPRVQRRETKPTGDIPVIDQGQEPIAGYTDRANRYCGRVPVVLFGDHTRAFKFVDSEFAVGADGVKVLEPCDGIDAKFLYYYLRSLRIESAGYSRHFKFLREFQVPRPAIEEQRRIVDILSRAEGILRLGREAERKAAELIPAIFIDMFGDPATNPNAWPQRPLSAVADVISGVAKGRKLDPREAIELPYMRVANVKDGYLDLAEVKTIEIKRSEVEKLLIRPGDLLMTEGGDPDKLGRAALWTGEIDPCVHQNHVFKVRSDRACLSPAYLRALAGSAYGKGYFLSVAKKTTGIASINKTQLSAFPVPLPPLPLQQAFERHVKAAESIVSQQVDAAEKAKAIFDAILSRAFGA